MSTWDERKRRANIKHHGLDFEGADAIWDNLTVTREDIRHSYGEARFVTFGLLEGEVVVLVIPSVKTTFTSFPFVEPRNMKRATTLKRPRNSAKSKDRDNPAWSEEMLGPPVVRRGRGRQKAPTKVSTTIRLDADVLAFFRAKGAGYQTRINDALRSTIKNDLTTRSSGRSQGSRR